MPTAAKFDENKLFTWQNINTFVRGIIEPHVVAMRKRHDSYMYFNDKRHEEFKADINKRFNEFKEWTINELTELRTWTQTEIKYLKDTLIDEETGMLKYEVIPVEQLIDVGTIVVWPVAKNSVAMDKYLECNGQRIPDGKAYYDLKSILGSDYVPDYRGVFLRGYGSCKSTHYVSTEDANQGYTLHQSGALGKLQGDCIRKIYGFIDTEAGMQTTYGCLYRFNNGDDGGRWGHDGWNQDCIGFDSSLVVPTDVENRPINIAVRYLIRAIASTN